MRLSISAKWIGMLGLALTLATGFFNHGIIALDDYAEGVSRFIPAQTNSFRSIIESAGFRLPLNNLIFLCLTKTALFIGLESPSSQLGFSLAVVGGIALSIHLLLVKHLFSSKQLSLVGTFLIALYFTNPLIFSRPLIENTSGAFVSLSCLFFLISQSRKHVRWIYFSILALFVGFLFRFQIIPCLLALFLVQIRNEVRVRFFKFSFFSLLCFLSVGGLDLALSGGFHRTLRSYLDYNVQFSSGHGTTPFYTFVLLFLGLSLPPAFIGRYRGFDWKKSYQGLLAPLLYFGVFVLAHSLIPHKEERFMIPVLPLFLVLLTPLAHYWIFEAKSRWRVAYFCSLNFLLLPLACFSTPQNNVISLVRYLDKHPEISTVINYGPSVILFPEAFSLRRFEVLPVKAPPFSVAVEYSGKPDCTSVHVANEVLYRQDLSTMKVLETFSPGPLEALLVKLNPRQNARRGRIFLLKDKNCD